MKIIKNILIMSSVLLLSIVMVSCSSKKETQSVSNKTISVYFVKSQKAGVDTVMPVKRNIQSNENGLKSAMTFLMQGPSAVEKQNGYYSEIPSSTNILSIQETSKQYIINLSTDFTLGGGSESITNRINQVKNTALKNAGNKKVYLEINGQKADYIGGEGVEVSQPLGYGRFN